MDFKRMSVELRQLNKIRYDPYPAFCDSSLESVYPLNRYLDDSLLGNGLGSV